MICQSCKTTVPDTARFCPQCGSTMEPQAEEQSLNKRCPQCGTENPVTAKFCKADGYDLQENREPAVQHEEPAVQPPESLICPACGTSNPPMAKFCRKDGTLLVNPGPPSPQTQTPPSSLEMPLSETDTALNGERETHAIDKPLHQTPEIPTAPAEPPEPAVEPPGEKQETLVCPVCGTLNLGEAKFCKKDGTPLIESSRQNLFTDPSTTRPAWPGMTETQPPADQGTEKTRTTRPGKGLWLAIAALLIILAGAGGYLYFSGRFNMKPADFQKMVNEELRTKGLNVNVEIDDDWVATVIGSARENSEKDLAIDTVKSHREIKGLVDNIILRIQRTPALVQTDINSQLTGLALNTLQAKVDENYIVYLTGYVQTMDDKMKAIDVLKGIADVKEIRDEINVMTMQPPQARQSAPQPQARQSQTAPQGRSRVGKIDSAKLEGEINQAMRSSGINSVTAEVRGDMTVTLKGTVRNGEDKQRVFDVMGRFPQVRGIKDVIFVVGS
jgi:osmotically-inducible protein OsmY/ribosomal protein L40E